LNEDHGDQTEEVIPPKKVNEETQTRILVEDVGFQTYIEGDF